MFLWPFKLIGLLIKMVVIAAVFLVIVGLAAQPNKADVAIVFGSKVETSGLPSERLKARLDTAADQFKNGDAREIIVSGGTGDKGFPESEVRWRAAGRESKSSGRRHRAFLSYGTSTQLPGSLWPYRSTWHGAAVEGALPLERGRPLEIPAAPLAHHGAHHL